MGSYEGWSALVRGCVVWLGMTDPCEGRDSLVRYADTGKEALADLILAWNAFDPNGEGIVLSEMIETLYTPVCGEDEPPERVHMRSAIEQFAGMPGGKRPETRRVAKKLAAVRRRIVGGMYLDYCPEEKKRGGAVWRLYRADGSPATLRLCDSENR